MLTQNVFQSHVGHSACPAAQNVGPQHIRKGKVLLPFPAQNEGAIPFGHLRKHHCMVFPALVIHIHRRLGPRKADLRISRDHGSHYGIRAAPVDQFDLQSLVTEISQLDSSILGRIKNGMGHFADRQLRACLLPAAAAEYQQHHRDNRRQYGKPLLHTYLPYIYKCFSRCFSSACTPTYISAAGTVRMSTPVMTRSMRNT